MLLFLSYCPHFLFSLQEFFDKFEMNEFKLLCSFLSSSLMKGYRVQRNKCMSVTLTDPIKLDFHGGIINKIVGFIF